MTDTLQEAEVRRHAMSRIRSSSPDPFWLYEGLLEDMRAAGLIEGDLPPKTDEDLFYRSGVQTVLKTAADIQNGDAVSLSWEGPLLVLRFFAKKVGHLEYVHQPIHKLRIGRTNIVTLPTAAAVAPIQPARRGRYPKGVVPIWRGGVLRDDREARRLQIEKRLGFIEGCLMSAAACRAEIAELQARP